MTSTATKTQSNPADEVIIVLGQDRLAYLDPPVQLPEPILHCRRRTCVPGGPHGYRQREKVFAHCGIDVQGRLCFVVGLVPRVRAVLEEHGYRVVVRDERKRGARLRADTEFLDAADAADRQFLEGVCQEPLGQVEVRDAADTAEKCALIAELFPQARLVVAVATREAAWRLWHELEVRLHEPVGLALTGTRRRGGRVLVGTFVAAKARARGKPWDILLLPDAEQATGDWAARLATELEFERAYAFVRPRQRPDRLLQLRLEEMAGPVMHRLARPRAPVRVVFLPVPPCTVRAKKTPLKRKRAAYWYNAVRNGHIAAVAEAVAAQDEVALRQFGFRRRDMKAVLRDRARVAVLVEAPEHARQLLLLLPGWRTLDAVPAPVSTSGQNNSKQVGPAIVTLVHAATKCIRADVVIRATGTEWPLRIKGFPPRRDEANTDEVRVIDFMDSFDERALADNKRRADDYQRSDMRVIEAQVAVK